MRPIFLNFFLFIITCKGDTATQYLFCADMNPQQFINIEQLTGMWYGIEILKHNSDEHYVQIGDSCPILHISESRDYPTIPRNNLHKNYNYGYNYGDRRPTIPTVRPTDPSLNYDYEEYGQNQPYHRTYNTRRYGMRNYENRELIPQMKRIRIWWDENGTGTEYNLKYNTSRPGFWISSGPQNGSELEPKYSDFAGTVQVIKAVGNHLVLTFCHQLPERQLFTILLSRENKLGQPDIHSVHNWLNRKGLSVNAIKKVCWNSARKIDIFKGTIILLLIFIYIN